MKKSTTLIFVLCSLLVFINAKNIKSNYVNSKMSNSGTLANVINKARKVETRKLDTSGMETSGSETNKVDDRKVDKSGIDTNKVNTNRVDDIDTSVVDDRKVDISRIYTSKVDTSAVDDRKVDIRRIDTSKVDISGVDTSGVDISDNVVNSEDIKRYMRTYFVRMCQYKGKWFNMKNLKNDICKDGKCVCTWQKRYQFG